jgi:hypothetical protein
METRVALDAAGALLGTDKSSTFANAHDYLRHYEFFFAEFRDQPINLIEIGVLGGKSVKTWKWYFPRAQIVGIDIEERCQAFREDRIDILTGSQVDIDFMRAACAKYRPTIVIDDGSHMAEHIIVTFETVFPLLAPGGLYIVEDLNCHFGGGAHHWQTETKYDAPGYFMQLALARVARGGNDRTNAAHPSISQSIDSITTAGGCVIIRKTHAERDTETARAIAQEFMRTNRLDWMARCRLALFIAEHGNRTRRALKLMEDVLAERATPEVLRIQAIIAMQAGDFQAAAAALAQADATNTPENAWSGRLTKLRAQLAQSLSR